MERVPEVLVEDGVNDGVEGTVAISQPPEDREKDLCGENLGRGGGLDA